MQALSNGVKKMNKSIFVSILVSTSMSFMIAMGSLALAAVGKNHDNHSHEHVAEHNDDDHDDHDDHDESNHIALSDKQINTAQIEIITIEKQNLQHRITAPGEIVVNSYRTSSVTPQINAKIIERYVRLGDHVKTGQALIRLAGVEMAEAQGILLEADRELRRVKELGRKVVSEKRYTAAEVSYHRAYSQVSAYGMTNNEIKKLLKEGDASKANGEFVLFALRDGTVIKDDFILGEIAVPGKVLMQVTDETRLWAEARLPAGSAAEIDSEANAMVAFDSLQLMGKVVQIRHLLDETTRTQSVYVEFDNPNHQLHPGQFVSVSIDSRQQASGIVVPTEAVLRNSEGHWQIFIETDDGEFTPHVIQVLASYGQSGNQLVIDGVEVGARVVGRGAFFVQSEIAKANFDPHNH